MVGDRAGRCRLRRNDHTNFIATWCNNRGGKVAGLHRRGKKGTVKMILHVIQLLAQHALSMKMTTVFEMAPMIVMVSAKDQGSKAKPVESGQSNQSLGRSDTKGGQQLEHPVPHRGDPTSSSFISMS
jgi:hypothetical protein